MFDVSRIAEVPLGERELLLSRTLAACHVGRSLCDHGESV
jgi:hypothetical protein